MLLYIAFIAAGNLCLGFLAGVYMRSRGFSIGFLERMVLRSGNSQVQTDGATNQEAVVQESMAQEFAEADDFDPQPSKPPAPELSPEVHSVTGLISYGEAETWLTHAMAEENDTPISVALVELAGTEERQLVDSVKDTVLKALEENQFATQFADRQWMLLLSGDDVGHATERLEALRHSVAAAEYIGDGDEVQTTLTCALREIVGTDSVERISEQLEDALKEALRYGGNRTFLHDGQSPGPVVPLEKEVETAEVAV